MADDFVDHGEILALAVKAIGYTPISDRYPYIKPGNLSQSQVTTIRSRLTPRYVGEKIIFCAGLREYQFPGDHISLQFSQYSNWPQTPGALIVPHPWGLAQTTRDVRWTKRPPLRVGFMGQTYEQSRAAKFASTLPLSARKWLLRGRLIKNIFAHAALEQFGVPIRYMLTFPRFEAINNLRRPPDPTSELELELINTEGFNQTAEMRETFINHLEWCTYVLCPRGCENYSFRVYEALRLGRVPVIIDTNMVIPDFDQIQRLCLIVKYDRLPTLRDQIYHDYNINSKSQMLDRQAEAFAYSKRISEPSDLAQRLLAKMTNFFAPSGASSQ